MLNAPPRSLRIRSTNWLSLPSSTIVASSGKAVCREPPTMAGKMEMSYVEVDIDEIDFHALAQDPRRRPFEKLRLDRGMRKLQRRRGAHWQNPVDGVVASSAAP